MKFLKKVKAANEAITTFEQYKKAVDNVADSAFAAHEQIRRRFLRHYIRNG